MPRFRASEWIVPPVVVPRFIQLPVDAVALLHG